MLKALVLDALSILGSQGTKTPRAGLSAFFLPMKGIFPPFGCQLYPFIFKIRLFGLSTERLFDLISNSQNAQQIQ
jgi:hypothetical protein